MPFLTAENADYAEGRGSVLCGPKSIASNLGKVSDLNERCSNRKSSPETSPKGIRLPWKRRRLGGQAYQKPHFGYLHPGNFPQGHPASLETPPSRRPSLSKTALWLFA